MKTFKIHPSITLTPFYYEPVSVVIEREYEKEDTNSFDPEADLYEVAFDGDDDLFDATVTELLGLHEDDAR